MESSIAEFLMRQLAFEQLPTLRAAIRDLPIVFTLAVCAPSTWHAWRGVYLFARGQVHRRCFYRCLAPPQAYLLGLLAMIKCSICSYQCDN